jgi:hypothetical protein
MDEEAALKIALAFVNGKTDDGSGALALVPGSTMRLPYGWLFSFDSATYLNGEDPNGDLVGIGPVLVRSEDGVAEMLRGNRPLPEVLREYEKKRLKRYRQPLGRRLRVWWESFKPFVQRR